VLTEQVSEDEEGLDGVVSVAGVAAAALVAPVVVLVVIIIIARVIITDAAAAEGDRHRMDVDRPRREHQRSFAVIHRRRTCSNRLRKLDGK